ncbi:MAG: AI-2E family transporter [Chitinophagales bacterium]
MGLVLTLLLLFVAADVFVPFIFALFFAILLNPMVNFLHRKRVPRVLAISLALLAGLAITAGVLALIAVQVKVCIRDSNELQGRFTVVMNETLNWIGSIIHMPAEEIKTRLTNMQGDAGKSLLKGLGGTLLTFSSFAISVFVIPVYIFLLLYYKPLLLGFVAKVFRKEHHQTVSEVLLSVNAILKNYLFGLLIEAAIVAALNSVGLLILGVRYAVLLGITGAILNLIPYIGGIIAVLLPMAIAFLTKSPVTALLVLGLYAIIQFVDNHYLVPYIVASRVRINAIICIMVVIAGGLIWGVAGMFLSIPLTALVKVICDHIEELKPWGYLLGDTMEETRNPILFKYSAKKKAG